MIDEMRLQRIVSGSAAMVISTTLLVFPHQSGAAPMNIAAGSKEPSADVVTVDEETRSPEGAAYATSTIFQPSGSEYKSTRKSIPRSLVEKIRQVALASPSNVAPDLKDFGITQESVLKNRDVMLESAHTDFFGRKRPYPPFESLPPEIQQLFSYDSVAKNALAEITGSMNSAYDCVRFSIPGDPPIVLLSHHRQSGMLPWRVIAWQRSWQTYSRELPRLLAQIASPMSAGTLAADDPDLRFQDMAGGHRVRTGYWPDGFFKQYSHWTRDQIESHEGIEAAKKLPGWTEASKVVTIEDALKHDSGNMLIQVISKDPQSPIDKVRFDISKPSDSFPHCFRDWTEFLPWYRAMERDAGTAQWLERWRKTEPNRSVLCIWSNLAAVGEWRVDSTQEFWTSLGLPSKLRYYFQLFKNGTHCGDALIGEPYKLSLITDLGPGGGPTSRLPKVMQTTSESVLRRHENGQERYAKRIWAVIDQNGKPIKKGPVPPNYALPANYPSPAAEDRPYNYNWPVDFSTHEDLEYLDQEIEGEPLESVSPLEEDLLYGLVSKNGNVLLAPKFEWIDAFSDELAAVREGDGKCGYIDRSGTLVIKPQFDVANAFHEGLAAVRKDGKWGFIDKTGTTAIPIVYDSVRRFSEGLAPVRRGTKFGYIDKTGQMVIHPQFGRARHFSDGLAYVQIDGLRAYIDHSGQPIGGKMYDRLKRFSEDRAVFLLNDKYGYIDRKGNQIIPPQFTRAEDFRHGVAEVMIGPARQAIDLSGKLIQRPPQHSDFWEGPITEGLIRTQQNDKYGFKNLSGKFVIKPIYDNVGVFSEGICPVELGEKWGAIDMTGNLVIKPQFDELDRVFSDHLISARTGKRWGVVDTTGGTIVGPLYDRIYPFRNGLAVIQNGIKYGYINRNGQVVFTPQFDAAHQFDNHGIAQVSMRAHEPTALDLP